MRPHLVHLGDRLDDRALDLARDRVRLVEGELARELEVERDLRLRADGEDAQVVDLAHARHALRRR